MTASVKVTRATDLAALRQRDRHGVFADAYHPTNMTTGRAYKGRNRELLTRAARESGMVGYTSWWATWRQWVDLGCKPRMGERPARVYYGLRFVCVWSFEQVNFPGSIPECVAPAFEELMELEHDRGMAAAGVEDLLGDGYEAWSEWDDSQDRERYIEGGINEVAATWGVSVGTIKAWRMRKGRALAATRRRMTGGRR